MKNYLKTAAVCSLLGAITTALLIFLPATPASTFDDQVLLSGNPIYMSKLWVLFLHPQLNVIAVSGIAVLLFRKAQGLVIIGTFFFLIWAVTEAAQQAFMIDAVNQIWRAGYSVAEDERMRQAFYNNLIGSIGLRDSMYFLLLYAFGMGSLFYGFACLRGETLGKWIGGSFLFFGLLSLVSFVRYYAGGEAFSGIVDWSYAWIYAWLQPLARAATGYWLWKEAANLMQG